LADTSKGLLIGLVLFKFQKGVHSFNELIKDIPEINTEQSEEPDNVEIARLLFLNVLVQCRGAGIGTLLLNKGIHVLERLYKDTTLVYYEKEMILQEEERFEEFLLKNHFRVPTGESQRRLLYQPLESMTTKYQEKSPGFWQEFIKLLCKKPFHRRRRSEDEEENKEDRV